MTPAAAQTITGPTVLGGADSPYSADTLAGEHAVLLRDVTRRATPVLALLDARAWPHAELESLIRILGDAVLRQVSDEEALLFPHDATAPPFAELSADHVRLHTLTAHLKRVHLEPCPPPQLRGLIVELLTTLRRHLLDEQAVLAALPEAPTEIPSAAALAAGGHNWPMIDDGPVVILLDTLPAEQATDLCIARLLRLRRGQSAEIHCTDTDKLSEICQWMHAFDSASFGMALAATGREDTIEITRRVTTNEPTIPLQIPSP